MKVLTVFGTRPEAIKMAPVVKELAESAQIVSKVCVTAQHREMLSQALDIFNITPDYDLDIMKPGQTLSDITCAVLKGMENVLDLEAPDIALVQGDTSTTFSAALAAYYRRIPVAHVEAGLRTQNIYSPWPEEANRRLVSGLSALHFAPTQQAYENLIQENVSEDKIIVTGNTVIDALLFLIRKFDTDSQLDTSVAKHFSFLRPGARMVLITGHRRENFGEGFRNICAAIAQLATAFPEVDFVYPVHLNPNVLEPVKAMLSNFDNVHLIEPLKYLHFVWMMRRSHLIVTDSGGIQEEAPALGKPVLVMRETTERPEAVWAGTARLVGPNKDRIFSEAKELLTHAEAYKKMSQAVNPFGDGTASKQIVRALETYASVNHMSGSEAMKIAV